MKDNPHLIKKAALAFRVPDMSKFAPVEKEQEVEAPETVVAKTTATAAHEIAPADAPEQPPTEMDAAVEEDPLLRDDGDEEIEGLIAAGGPDASD